LIITAAGAALAAGAAFAGGVERSTQSVAILFEEGNYAELTFGSVEPSVTGVATPAYGGIESGNMSEDYTQSDFGVKFGVSEKVDVALVFDHPIGADVFYPKGASAPVPFGTDYTFSGGNADLNSRAINVYLRYKLPNNFSLIAGIRQTTAGGTLGIPFFNNYTLEVEDTSKIGYTAGFAWEKPEIAARVALTYNSSTTHKPNAVENSDGGPIPTFPNFDDFTNQFEVEIPQSVNLEFRTGIAQDTLLFGSIRWVDWTAFEITPVGFGTAVGSLVDYKDDRVTYNLGIGRRLNETWAIGGTVGYEETLGGFSGNLGPTDGFKSLGVGATYTNGKIKVSGGVRKVEIGDAKTRGPLGGQLASFKDNSAFAWGFKIGYSF